ncbi:MAG: hypothetical protein ACE5J2_08915 [Nitrososphaerales archaeon]
MANIDELLYSKPIMIYDNFCYSCTKLANFSHTVSKGRIYLVGHYTKEGMRIKRKAFPKDFDPNSMFWLINRRGAFGGRSGLFPLVKEVVKGFFGITPRVNIIQKAIEDITPDSNLQLGMACNANDTSCATPTRFFKRLSGLLKNGKKVKLEGQDASC